MAGLGRKRELREVKKLKWVDFGDNKLANVGMGDI
jgi:hypothetical protein